MTLLIFGSNREGTPLSLYAVNHHCRSGQATMSSEQTKKEREEQDKKVGLYRIARVRN